MAGTVAVVAPGTLPHEVPAGGWQVCLAVDKPWDPQPAVAVRALGDEDEAIDLLRRGLALVAAGRGDDDPSSSPEGPASLLEHLDLAEQQAGDDDPQDFAAHRCAMLRERRWRRLAECMVLP